MSKRAAVAEIEPTIERRQHGPLAEGQAAVIGPTGRVVGYEKQFRDLVPLAIHRIALRYPQEIAPRLISAAMQLREDWERAGVEPRQVSAYSPLGASGQDDDEETPIARTRAYGRALSAIRLQSIRAVVEYVVIHDLDDGRVGLLKVGLKQLADHYRIDA